MCQHLVYINVKYPVKMSICLIYSLKLPCVEYAQIIWCGGIFVTMNSVFMWFADFIPYHGCHVSACHLMQSHTKLQLNCLHFDMQNICKRDLKPHEHHRLAKWLQPPKTMCLNMAPYRFFSLSLSFSICILCIDCNLIWFDLFIMIIA